jgi:hypothetical protein
VGPRAEFAEFKKASDRQKCYADVHESGEIGKVVLGMVIRRSLVGRRNHRTLGPGTILGGERQNGGDRGDGSG